MKNASILVIAVILSCTFMIFALRGLVKLTPPVKTEMETKTETGTKSETETKNEEEAAVDTKGTFPIAWFCATERLGATKIYVALRDRDSSAVAGLVDRGQAFEVNVGDHFTSLSRIDSFGIAAVYITSGYHVGQTCYLPGRYITRWKD